MATTAAPKGIWKVITASSVGTLIEWYDFYIFGSLSTIIAAKFFPSENPTAALLSTLATFAAGFIVRPFGALVFGRLGDLIGRKYTFLLTLVLMGLSTFLIGCIPSYETIGAAAPLLVLLLRLLQGLALGGEYGGAATYVAEHAPANRRGFYTSWIQTTATLGLFLSLGVILSIRRLVGVDEFTNGNGWRYPFLISIVLVIVSIFIRLRMSESPLFAKLKGEGKTSKNPLKESFGNKTNFRMVLLALFGATMGQGVIWYTGQFYAQTFLLTKCNIEYEQANSIILIALVFATPFFVFFGWLSDKIGRKNIMMAGMLLGVLLYRPIFSEIYKTADTKPWLLSMRAFNDHEKQTSKEDTLKTKDATMLITSTKSAWNFNGNKFIQTRNDTLKINNVGNNLPSTTISRSFDTATMVADKKPAISNVELNSSGKWKLILLIAIMVLFVTMVYGPIAAFLVELFPTKIRYTSMSLPYHIGNGVFGGLVPFIATLITTIKGTDHLSGLWYPIGVGGLCFIIGSLYLSNKIDNDVSD